MIGVISGIWELILKIQDFPVPRRIFAYLLFLIAALLFIASSIFCLLMIWGLLIMVWKRFDDIAAIVGTIVMLIGAGYLIDWIIKFFKKK